jgi:hypothetical protein
VWIGAVFLYLITRIGTFALKAYMALGVVTEFNSIKLRSNFAERFSVPFKKNVSLVTELLSEVEVILRLTVSQSINLPSYHH